MIRIFVGFLREHFDVRNEQLRVWCNLFADHAVRQREIEDSWLGVVGVPRACLYRSAVNVHSRDSRRKRKNMLPHGTCRVSVCSTEIVQTIFGSIQELGGFERRDWLG